MSLKLLWLDAQVKRPIGYVMIVAKATEIAIIILHLHTKVLKEVVQLE